MSYSIKNKLESIESRLNNSICNLQDTVREYNMGNITDKMFLIRSVNSDTEIELLKWVKDLLNKEESE